MVTRFGVSSAIILATLIASDAAGQVSPRCTEAAYRQMDFWVGEWNVTDDEGKLVGTSVVTPIMDGCAVREEWHSGEMHGTSLNMYDKPEGVWRQVWVDNFGAVLRMTGAANGREMILNGTRKGSDGKTRQLRVTLTPMPDGSLRQVQERSEDGGSSWGVIFTGHYRTGGR